MAAGIARIVFAGGSLTLPAQTPYDREQLMEHVLGSARSKQDVRVRVDHTTWVIERLSPQDSVVCNTCARRLDHAMCRRRRATAAYCVACALARPQLSIAFLSELPLGATLRDVQAHSAYAGEWIPWTRWPQATPAEIIEDMRLQRRFAPVLTWRCAEIRLPAPGTPPRRLAPRLAQATTVSRLQTTPAELRRIPLKPLPHRRAAS